MSGLVKEILRNPTVKDIARGHLKSISEDGSRTLVKDFMWQDVEVSLGVLATLPSVINSCVGAVAQLVTEFNAKFPPLLLKEYVVSVLKDVNQSQLKDCGNAVATMARNTLAVSPEVKTFVIEKGPKLIASGINIGTTSVNEICLSDPTLISVFMKQVIDNLDKPALREATLNLADAFLDQKLGLVSWTLTLIKRRIIKFFRRFRPQRLKKAGSQP
jgi:hypothetical protein